MSSLERCDRCGGKAAYRYRVQGWFTYRVAEVGWLTVGVATG